MTKIKMTESELVSLIDSESANAIGAEDRLSRDRATAMSFYMGEAKGDLAPPDSDGRSRVVSKDVQEVVEWVHPTLMRTFAGSEQVVKFEPTCQGDEEHVKAASEYVSYLFYRKNPGYTILSDAIKAALIQRHSFVKVYWDETHVDKEEHYEGLSQVDLEALQNDPEIDIVKVEIVQAQGQPMDIASMAPQAAPQAPPMQPGMPQQPPMQGQPPATPQGGMLPPDALGGGHPISMPLSPDMLTVYNVTAKRSMDQSKVTIEGIPQERMRVSKDTRYLENVRFIEHRESKTISDLYSLGYDRKLVDELASDMQDEWSEEAIERGDYDDSRDDINSGDDSQREVLLQDCYIRCDFDGDGIAEYRRIVKCGTTIFSNDVVDDHPFAMFDCLLMPHKLVGIGMYDLLEDIQRIKTAGLRQTLDNFYMAVNPRKLVSSTSNTDLDALIHAQPNGIVLTDDINSVGDLVTPFVGQAGLSMLEMFSQVRDGRSGVSSFNQGLTGGELSKSQLGSEGVESLLNQGQQRIELIARNLAEGGMKRVWSLILKLITQHQNRHDQIMIDGEWLAIDPRAWASKYDMTVSVGIGTSSKKEQIQNLMMIGQVVEKAGMQVPGIVTPENVYNLMAKLIKASGEHNPDQYISNPQNAPPPPQQPDPNAAAMAKVQADSQSKQAELQLKAQVNAQKQQGDIQVEQSRQSFQAQQNQLQIQAEASRNTQQLQNEFTLKQYQIDKDFELAQFKANLAYKQAVDVAHINASAKVVAAEAMGAKDTNDVDALVAHSEAQEATS